MNDDELRSILRSEADRVEAGPDSWSRIESRLTAPWVRTAPRSFAFGALAIAVVVALVLGLVWIGRGDRQTRAASSPPPRSMPRQIVAVTNRFQLVVLDAQTGKVVRTLARDVATFRGTPEIATSPDGSQIYFTAIGDPTPSCATSGIETVFRVQRDGGTRVVVGQGRTVAVNGERVAFSRDSEDCRVSGPGAIEIRDGGESRVLAEASDPSQNGSALFNLSWSGDGDLLSFDRARGGLREGWNAPYVLEAATAARVDLARCLCRAPKGLESFGFLGRSHDLLAATPRGADKQYSERAVVLRENGSIRRTLLRWHADISGLESDASAQHFIMLSPAKRAATGKGYVDVLYRWTEGDKKPTKVRDGIIAAAWIPNQTPKEVPSRPEPPSIVVALTNGIDAGPTVVLDATTGAELSPRLHNDPPAGSISATADGTEIVFSPPMPTDCANDGGPGVQRRPVGEGRVTSIVSGSFAPVVNSHNLVAYGIVCDGPALGFTDLNNGQNYRSDPLGGRNRETSPKIRRVEPLGWSPDGRRLVYRLGLRGEETPHYYVGSLWPAVRAKRANVVEIPGGAKISAATFLDNDQVILAVTAHGKTQLRTWKVGRSSRATPTRVVGSLPRGVSALVGDRSGSYVLALEHGRLLRWDRGHGRSFRVVADHIAAASWLGSD